MRMITTLLWMIFFLSSCRSFERQVICQEIDKYQIKPIPLCDVSFQFNRCRCRCFDYNKWETLPDIKKCKNFQDVIEKRANISWIASVTVPNTRVIRLDAQGNVLESYQAKDFPIEYCEGVAGPFLEDIAVNVRPNIKALHEVKNKLCK